MSPSIWRNCTCLRSSKVFVSGHLRSIRISPPGGHATAERTMRDSGFRAHFLMAGMSQSQIDAALSNFELTGEALAITSKTEYWAARATYARMDGSRPSDELFSSDARYILSLGEKLAEWERKSKTDAFECGRK